MPDINLLGSDPAGHVSVRLRGGAWARRSAAPHLPATLFANISPTTILYSIYISINC